MAAARPRPAPTFPGAGRPAAAPRPWVFVVLAIAGLAVAALVVLALMPRGNSPAGPAGPNAPAARPVPSSPATALPITPTPTPVPDDGTPRPAGCDELYSPSMVEAMGDLVLNPAWSAAPGTEVLYGTDDAQLRGIIDTAEHLNCIWGTAEGGSDTGLVTDLVWVTPEQSATVKARLDEAGLRCYEELEGLRCIAQETAEAGTFGESHFLRDGIWLATKYTNAGPDGYTHDIIGNVWKDA
ncbi:hypothetical protein [Cryobacterium tagatosivorans]|uniref:DUF3558 domain-containing protein n=1 Tax=Cryobacterium tagatosivorans TaxID=1259199 RepID=A0A4R8UBN2_9MICO|nr:hypothetical protein [Cryobacterium tagatosivorans]TFB48427.1 hypothetical protein E3O23_13230 [Cryobacterium tagatosivorans]